MPAPSLTLIAEATRRSGVVWVSADGDDPQLVWHLWHGDALYLVGGGGEQPLPELTDRALVVVRSKASQSDQVVRWEAEVTHVRPGPELWDEVVPLLVAERLNTPSIEGLAHRWAQESVVLRLAPAVR